MNQLTKKYEISFVSYLKDKKRKEILLKTAQMNMAKKSQVA